MTTGDSTPRRRAPHASAASPTAGRRLAAIGPGLLLAAAAIGVSHLVQATRAGADYGLGLLWAVLLVNLFKYPFLEYGPRFAAATGRSMLDGYWQLSRHAVTIYFLFTLGTMFAIQAALALVTANLAIAMTGLSGPPILWAAGLLAVSAAILYRGHYRVLDGAIKWIVAVLAVSTLVAVVAALIHGPAGDWATATPKPVWSAGGIAFLIALMGWMPIPIDAAAWHSLWTLERARQTGRLPTLAHARLDFNIGYIGTCVLAIGFLALGALVMYATGTLFSDSGAVFAEQLIGLYTDTLGTWAWPLIAACAFTAMFSTLLTVLDAHPRVMRHMIAMLAYRPPLADSVGLYRGLLVAVPTVSLGVLYLLGSRFTVMIDLATSLSFLTAPVLAWLNYRLVMSRHLPERARPGAAMQWLSRAGLVFLSGFAVVYVGWRLVG
ncbi:NRAMP family divalent metal transporter [Salinisphaera sp. Q1T1-3]|uniref:NRAMP family divalent metal transporter n=1 Tax=Salinisphaera sp. Q1T1-3 TaxID=2321229 RepID=UPI000E7629A3|nr:divalent metal cation transporter [Salinisphaera sp. Q1T1-3]RJS91030.1 divalent metal cation transporter [Salinisphaera sp. Q1T1-3]